MSALLTSVMGVLAGGRQVAPAGTIWLSDDFETAGQPANPDVGNTWGSLISNGGKTLVCRSGFVAINNADYGFGSIRYESTTAPASSTYDVAANILLTGLDSQSVVFELIDSSEIVLCQFQMFNGTSKMDVLINGTIPFQYIGDAAPSSLNAYNDIRVLSEAGSVWKFYINETLIHTYTAGSPLATAASLIIGIQDNYNGTDDARRAKMSQLTCRYY